jgi:DNA-directed RNA polymerase subunit L
MKVNVIKNESKELVLEFETSDFSIPDLIAGELLKNEDVEFAGVAKDHPETGKPTLNIKTGKRKAQDTLEKALDDLDGEFEDLKAQLSKAK